MRIAQPALAALLLASACANGVESAAADGTADQLPETSWLAEDIRGGGVLDRLQTTLSFVSEGSVAGTGGCNRYSGPVEIKGSSIRFGTLAATMMACPPAAMQQEQRFFDALAEAKEWQRTPERKLILLDGSGRKVVVLSLLPMKGG